MNADPLIASIRERYDHCFGCGLSNPLGLRLDGFEPIADGVAVHWVPREEYRGFEGILHGGIVAAALDEVMAWAAMIAEGVFVYTGTLEFRYSSKAPVAASYRLEGSVHERRGRRLKIEGRLHVDGNRTPVATATGLFVVAGDVGSLDGDGV